MYKIYLFVIKISSPIEFEWDEGNVEKNKTKHNVSSREAEEIFLNKPLKTRKDIKHSQKENRFIAFGSTNSKRKLYVVFTIRNNKLRVISARNQSKKERNYYEKQKS